MSTATQMIARTGLPSRAVRAGLATVRLPLSTVERVTGRRGTTWAPAVGFAKLEATVLQTAGDLLADEELASEGRRKQAGVSKMHRAAEADAEAERYAREADERYAQRRDQADEFSERASQRAAEMRERVEDEAEEKREQAERAARQRSAKAKERAAETQEGLRKRARADRLATARDREEALEAEVDAVDAEEKVLDLDARIEASREARKARRSS